MGSKIIMLGNLLPQWRGEDERKTWNNYADIHKQHLLISGECETPWTWQRDNKDWMLCGCYDNDESLSECCFWNIDKMWTLFQKLPLCVGKFTQIKILVYLPWINLFQFLGGTQSCLLRAIVSAKLLWFSQALTGFDLQEIIARVYLLHLRGRGAVAQAA